MKNTRRSFQKEWDIFKYSDKSWGLTLDDRKHDFLKQFDVKPEELKGKTLLDAGCGNGILTSGLGDFGLKVVGLEQVDLTRANEYNKNKNVKFVQGSVLNPPFKAESFDFIFSSGVIHHTSDPKKAFEELLKLVKKGGKFYFWIYRRKKGVKKGQKYAMIWRIKYPLIYAITRITCRLPMSVQHLLYSMFTAIFQVFSKKRTWTERMVWFYDSLSPRYQSMHTLEELSYWFIEQGYYIKFIDERYSKHGYGLLVKK